jgi:hypothetical protein
MRGTTSGWVALVMAMSGCCSAGRADPGETVEAKDTALMERVRALLSGYEHVPTAEAWAKVGDAAEVSQALMAIATEPGARTITAARATSSLGFFPRPEVATFLVQRTGDERLDATLRGKAAIALGLAFGDEHADALAPLFANPDAGLREDAARAFRHLLSPAAERFLEARIDKEPAPHIRESMAGARLQIVEKRKAAEDRGALSDRVKSRPALKDPGPVR